MLEECKVSRTFEEFVPISTHPSGKKGECWHKTESRIFSHGRSRSRASLISITNVDRHNHVSREQWQSTEATDIKRERSPPYQLLSAGTDSRADQSGNRVHTTEKATTAFLRFPTAPYQHSLAKDHLTAFFLAVAGGMRSITSLNTLYCQCSPTPIIDIETSRIKERESNMERASYRPRKLTNARLRRHY